jgi:hypothetical protein
MSRGEFRALVKRAAKLTLQLQPMLPNIEKHDLHLIICQLLKPPIERVKFMRKIGDAYVL